MGNKQQGGLRPILAHLFANNWECKQWSWRVTGEGTGQRGMNGQEGREQYVRYKKG